MKPLQWSLAIGTKNLTTTALLASGFIRFTVFKKGKHYNVSEHNIDTDVTDYYDYDFDTETEAVYSVEKEYALRWEEKGDGCYLGTDYGVDAYTDQKEWWDT